MENNSKDYDINVLNEYLKDNTFYSGYCEFLETLEISFDRERKKFVLRNKGYIRELEDTSLKDLWIRFVKDFRVVKKYLIPEYKYFASCK